MITHHGERGVLRLALLFLVVSLVAALFGFGWVAALEFSEARVLCLVSLVLAVVLVVANFRQGARLPN
jgi:uncharacterized membrane protein YtjA (UPF0391 family)